MTTQIRNCLMDHVELVLGGGCALISLGLAAYGGYLTYEMIDGGVILHKIQTACCPVLANHTSSACQLLLSDFQITTGELPDLCQGSPGVNYFAGAAIACFSAAFAGVGVVSCRHAKPITVLTTWKDKIASCCRKRSYHEIPDSL